jgi:CelD/BcsL family acetyltransferase involved in cellulose biosynthesis
MEKQITPKDFVDERKLQAEVYENFEDLCILQPEWDAFVEKLNAPVYMSYDWCRIWWQIYGSGKDLRIYVFSGNGQIVAIVPIYIDCLTVGPLNLKVARLVGANIPPRIFDPPINKDWANLVFETIALKLFGEDNCDVFSLGPVSSLYPLISDIKKLSEGQINVIGQMEEHSADVHSFFILPETFEGYLGSLSKNERKNRRKYQLRYLKKSFAIQTDILTSWNEIREEFQKFVEMHTAQWRSEGKPGHFGAWPKSVDFNFALVKQLSEQGRVRLIRIRADDEAISYQYSFAFGDCYFWQLPARKIGASWEQYSLGSTSLVNMIKIAIEEGMKRIEAGLAHYDYKIRLGAKEYPATTIFFTANDLGSRFRYFIFRSIFSVINVIYYKIWYRRLQPHLPKRLQPGIWSLWIRFSF